MIDNKLEVAENGWLKKDLEAAKAEIRNLETFIEELEEEISLDTIEYRREMSKLRAEAAAASDLIQQLLDRLSKLRHIRLPSPVGNQGPVVYARAVRAALAAQGIEVLP